MCGLAGIVAPGGLDLAAERPRLDRALARLAPRGPDGEGVWEDGAALLGHRRLAIVDLSPAGAQPMRRGPLAVVFNGMIYNYRALRAELAALGHAFASDCDTEVLLAGWRQWGADLLPRIEGMFAFALWDGAARTLHLARDRFGKKPLVFAARGSRLVFASDVLAAARLMDRPPEIDPAALYDYFAWRFIPAPRTIYRGLEKLLPGERLEFSAAGVTRHRWFAPARRAPFADETEAAAELRRLVEGAVADRLVADVPVGAFLSGGIDSAIVAACMTKASGAVRTYTVGFEGVPDYYEERPAARAVARHLGTTHTEIAVSAADALAAIGPALDGLDEPFADSSAIPTFIVARETRRHVTVALSGDGADEAFGGYRKYQGELLAERYRRVPAILRRGAIEPILGALPEGKGGRWLERARRARRFAAHAGKPAAERQAGWARLADDEAIAALLARPATGARPEERIAALRAGGDAADPLNAMLDADLALGLPDDMLAKVDRMSMANSLEVRCPFLDSRVIAAARAMPGSWKIARGRGKAILRRAFADALPAETFERPKKGFEIPLDQWLRGPLAGLAESAATGDAGGWLKPDLPRRWWAEHRGGRRDRTAELWSMIVLAEWLQRRRAEAA